MAVENATNQQLIDAFLGSVKAVQSASEIERITGISADSVTRFRSGDSKQLSKGMRDKLAAYLRRKKISLEPLATGDFEEGARWGYVRAARDLLNRALDGDQPVSNPAAKLAARSRKNLRDAGEGAADAATG